MSGGRHDIQRHPVGFDLDTAVATGAALYALAPQNVTDVSPGTYGIKVMSRQGRTATCPSRLSTKTRRSR